MKSQTTITPKSLEGLVSIEDLGDGRVLEIVKDYESGNHDYLIWEKATGKEIERSGSWSSVDQTRYKALGK